MLNDSRAEQPDRFTREMTLLRPFEKRGGGRMEAYPEVERACLGPMFWSFTGFPARLWLCIVFQVISAVVGTGSGATKAHQCLIGQEKCIWE